MKQSEILHESHLDEEANTNPRTRIVGMKWVELGKGKDPAWGVPLFLYRKVGDLHNFHVGSLNKIESLQTGKQYSFIYNDEDATATFTHYSIPQPPKV